MKSQLYWRQRQNWHGLQKRLKFSPKEENIMFQAIFLVEVHLSSSLSRPNASSSQIKCLLFTGDWAIYLQCIVLGYSTIFLILRESRERQANCTSPFISRRSVPKQLTLLFYIYNLCPGNCWILWIKTNSHLAAPCSYLFIYYYFLNSLQWTW